MPFTHHSHSGQFCSHGSDTLSSILSHASHAGFHTFACTEHIPRGPKDIYPGETGDRATQEKLFDTYYAKASHLKEHYDGLRRGKDAGETGKEGMSVLVGLEGEWIRWRDGSAEGGVDTPTTNSADDDGGDSESIIRHMLGTYDIDFWLGSVHHVHGIPIDFDRAFYEKAMASAIAARDALAGDGDVAKDEYDGEEVLFSTYYDAQHALIATMRPLVLAHFDLPRLYSTTPDRAWAKTEGVWERVVRNLKAVKGYGGLLEVSSAAWRKGLKEPYPAGEVVRAWREMGGDVVVSDDSHCIAHVGAEYARWMGWLRECGVKRVAYLSRKDVGGVDVNFMSVEEMASLPFWQV